MKTYEEIIESNKKYLKQNPKQKRYSFKSEYYNNFLTGTHEEEPLQAMIDLFDYGFVSGHKQAMMQTKNKLTNSLSLNKKTDCHIRLLQLIYDMPDWAESTFDYLYSFIAHGMLPEEERFPMSVGHFEEIIDFCEQQQKESEKNELEKTQLTDKEKKHMKAISDASFKLVKYAMLIKDERLLNFLCNIAMNYAIDSDADIESSEYLKIDIDTRRILDIITWLRRMESWKTIEIIHKTTNIFYNDELKARGQIK